MVPKTNIIREELTASTKEADVPITFEYPIFDADTVPVIIAPGWTEGQVAFERLRHQFAVLGRPAVTMEHSHAFSATMFNPGLGRAKDIHAVMKKVHDTYGYDKFDIVAHSLDGVAAKILAEHEGEAVRSLTLMASAGLIEDDTMVDMMSRLKGAALHEMGNFFKHPAIYQKVALDSLSQFCRNPARGVVEAMYAGNIDIRDGVRELGSQGLRISCVQFARDSIFEVERVNQSTQDVPFAVRTIHEMQHAGHNAPSLYPRQVAEHIVKHILDADSSAYALAS